MLSVRPPVKNKRTQRLEFLRPMLDTPSVDAFISLLENEVDIWKESLVEAKGDSVLKYQGAIEKVRSLLVDLKRGGKVRDFKTGAYIGE